MVEIGISTMLNTALLNYLNLSELNYIKIKTNKIREPM